MAKQASKRVPDSVNIFGRLKREFGDHLAYVTAMFSPAVSIRRLPPGCRRGVRPRFTLPSAVHRRTHSGRSHRAARNAPRLEASVQLSGWEGPLSWRSGDMQSCRSSDTRTRGCDRRDQRL